MPDIGFVKGHGTGNDFVLVADPDGLLDLAPSDVARICDRHTGVGADGLMRAVRVVSDAEGAAAAADDPAVQWFMDYRNADGSAAEMCGNGIRVFTAFLVAEGLLELTGEDEVRIATRGGVVPVRRSAEGFAADLGTWTLGGDDVEVRVAGLAVARPGQRVAAPNPHVVVVVADDQELDGADLSAAPLIEPVQPAGANVELVRPGEPLVVDGVGRIRMRVHERGSGETLSCGTGAVAAAVAVRHLAGPGAPGEWRVQVPGGELRVRVVAAPDGEHAVLSGPAELVFSGELALP